MGTFNKESGLDVECGHKLDPSILQHSVNGPQQRISLFVDETQKKVFVGCGLLLEIRKEFICGRNEICEIKRDFPGYEIISKRRPEIMQMLQEAGKL